MGDRQTEKVTLHFDLSHCPPDQEFSLGALGRKHRLARAALFRSAPIDERAWAW
jgi:hypothetical protein